MPSTPPRFQYSGPTFQLARDDEHYSFSAKGTSGSALRIPVWALLNVELVFDAAGAAFLQVEGHFESVGPATRRLVGPIEETEAVEALRALSGRLPIPRSPVVREQSAFESAERLLKRKQLIVTTGELQPSHPEGPNFGAARVSTSSADMRLEPKHHYRITGYYTPPVGGPSLGYGGPRIQALTAEETTPAGAESARPPSDDAQSQPLASFFAFHGIQHLRSEAAIAALCHDAITTSKWLTSAHPDHWGWVNFSTPVVHPGCLRREGRVLQRILETTDDEAGDLVYGRREIEGDPNAAEGGKVSGAAAVRQLLRQAPPKDEQSERAALVELFELYERVPQWMTLTGFPIPPRAHRNAEAEAIVEKLLQTIVRNDKLVQMKAPAVIIQTGATLVQRHVNDLWELTVKSVASRFPALDPKRTSAPALAIQSRLEERVRRATGSHARYEVDLPRRSLTWLDASGKPRLEAGIRVLGTWSAATEELLFGWANPALPKGCAIEPLPMPESERATQKDAFAWALLVAGAVGCDAVFRSVAASAVGTEQHLFLALWRITPM